MGEGADGASPIAVLVNGIQAHCLNVQDRGLLYGDGLFETIAVLAGGPCLWHAHWQRLANGARRLGIPPPSESMLRAEIGQLLDGAASATLKVVLTRGSGPRGYRPPATPHPTRILMRLAPVHDDDSGAAAGVAVRLCRTRLGMNPALAGIKHLNRLEQVLARAEWSQDDVAEGLMFDVSGALTCGTMSNVFLVRDGVLLTPRVDQAGVAGTVRARVLERARSRGMPVEERRLSGDDLRCADGAFLTNALHGCRPITRVGNRALDIAALPADLLAQVQQDVFQPDPDW